jgi:hypothetical protein
MDKCEVEGCNNSVSKPGHKLCYNHWVESQAEIITPCVACGKYKDNDYPLCKECYRKSESKKTSSTAKTNKDDSGEKDKFLLATTIADHFGLTSRKVNQILTEMGWIKKTERGNFPTKQGTENGGKFREHPQSGSAYVVWETSILNNKALINSIKEYKGESIEIEKSAVSQDIDKSMEFRNAFPATKTAQDGHKVRSRGELLIDNYLYTEKILHAYERRLPFDDECFCDFYIPEKSIYIEYWGLEDNDPKYAERKKRKLEIYKKHNLDLIEITNDQIDSLDDYLPKELRRRGIEVS